jgi:hypothetical protein
VRSVTDPTILSDQEEMVAAFASQLRPGFGDEEAAADRSELPRILLCGLPAAAAYLGLSTHQLRVWLEYGGPISTIARAQGRPTDGVVAVFVESAVAYLEPLLAVGQVDSAQFEILLRDLGSRLGTIQWEASRSNRAA